MYLIDSSAWIEYLQPNGSQKAKQQVHAILKGDDAVTCGIVVVEVLRGVRNESDYEDLKTAMLSLPLLPIDEYAIERAAKWGFALGRKSRIVPTTDLFIASCAYKKATIIHLDRDFEIIRSVADIEEKRISSS